MHQSRLVSVLKAVAIAAVVLCVPRLAEAQTGKISGVVTDAQSGQPLEGVQVIVQGTGLGALTSSNGRYFIISVAPGTYTVVGRRLGYQPVEQSGVSIRIDVTREINFSLSSAASTLAAQRIVAPPTPLVERGITGSAQAVSSEVIEALPVTSVAGVLALQQGFLQVPQNTDIVSFTDTRRNVISPIRIRGGRAGETLTLIDGIPINNVVFGGPAFDITKLAIQQIDYQKGGFEPQYGNALSGIINLATREGGAQFAGNVEYQSTGLSGKLGNTADELRGFDLLSGFISGPVPGTASKLRFVVAGQQQSGSDAVYEFDNDVSDFDRQGSRLSTPKELDVFSGWRAFGYDNQHDIFGKLTFNATSGTKLNFTVIDYERQRRPFDFDYLLVGFNPLDSRGVNSLQDTLGIAGFLQYQNVVQGSIRADRQLYSGALEQRFGRSNLTVRVARFEQARETCNFFQGVCLGSRFADPNFNDRFIAPGITQGVPVSGTDEFFGGESVKTNIFRADLQSQVTDHHNLQGGLFLQRHDILFAEKRNLGTNDVFVVPQQYAAKPYDAAAYFQDRIEYDFLTVKLGFRFDYGKAAGSSYADPLDPTNGTTAREVCTGTAGSLKATTPFTFVDDTGATFTGLAACNLSPKNSSGRPGLLDSATRLASQDDFKEAAVRKAFSPRVGVSFPLSERSSFFFNAGRYYQNPLYNNLYQNTGIGTVAGGEDPICPAANTKFGSKECFPVIVADAYSPAFVGNANLLTEQSTAYEIGYAAELGQKYAVNLAVFSKDQAGLSGIRQARRLSDIGSTYGTSLPSYGVIVNQDYTTSRGVEAQFRRRITNFWGYDINYSFSKSATNAAPPERQQQSQQEGDPTQLREITSEIDQPHVFNASLIMRVDDQAPTFRYGRVLTNSYATVTLRAASGLPYTPTSSFSGFGDVNQSDVNSGRGPTTSQVDLLAGKNLRTANLRYGVFVRVQNLFDSKNCVQVFVTTGRCDAGTIDQDRARQGNPVGENTSSTFFDRPQFFGARRSIYSGVKVTF